MTRNPELSRRIDQLTPEQRAGLLSRSRAPARLVGQDTIPATDRTGLLPLSAAQERFWFLQQLLPDNPLYSTTIAVRLEGRLDVGAVIQALNEIVIRHEILRTVFENRDGRVGQIVRPPSTLPVPVIDLRLRSEGERATVLSEHCGDDARRGFDLGKGPLLRTTLVRLQEDVAVLILTLPHIVSDGQSARVLVHEMSVLYSAFTRGLESPLAPLTVQYGDYAVWERSNLRGEQLSRQADYWRLQLAGLEALDLPVDKARPLLPAFEGQRLKGALDPSLSRRVRELSRNRGVTVFMLLLAAFQALLHRYSGQVDIAVGTPIANRRFPELNDLIGPFLNSIVLRTSLEGDPTFRALLARVREVALAAYRQQDLPFESVVAGLRPERERNRQPLFQVMFSLQNVAGTTLEMDGLNPQASLVENGTAKFDLTLNAREGGDQTEFELEFNAELFTLESAQQILANYLQLIENVVCDPDTRLSQLPPRAGQLEPVRTAPPPMAGDAAGLLLAERVEWYATHTPAAIALDGVGSAIDYRELNASAEQAAANLERLGVSPADTVGICVDTPEQQIVAALAVLKIGASFAGIDLNQPVPGGIRWVIASAPPSQTAAGLHIMLFTEIAVTCLPFSPRRTPSPLGHKAGAVFFVPHGVDGLRPIVYPHSALGSRLDGNRCGDRVMQAVNIGSESCFAAFAVLSAGACLIPLNPGISVAPRKLALLISDVRATRVVVSIEMLVRLNREFPWALTNIVRIECDDAPSHWDRQKNPLPAEVLTRLRWRLSAPGTCGPYCRIRSLRGSELSAAEFATDMVADVHLLDESNIAVPMGVMGELCVPGVSGALIRSGEWAFRRRNGNIVHRGRRDRRILHRGILIDPADVEAILKKQSGCIEAAVVPSIREGSVEAVLEAFIVPTAGWQSNIEQLQEHLRRALPLEWRPARIRVVPAIPRALDGSVDVSALNRPERLYVAPRDEAECALCDVWARLLRVEKVGVHDNFFELGGDSIMTAQAVAMAAEAGIEITVRALFEKQTIFALAPLTACKPKPAHEPNQTGDVPLSPIQERFFSWELARPGQFNQSLLLRMASDVDSDILAKTVSAILDRHGVLRLRYERGETGWNQFIDKESRPGFYCHVDLGELAPDEQVQAMAQGASVEFDLRAGGLFTAIEYNLGVQRGRRLLIVIHHLAVDGVSWRILLDDLDKTYKSLRDLGCPLRRSDAHFVQKLE